MPERPKTEAATASKHGFSKSNPQAAEAWGFFLACVMSDELRAQSLIPFVFAEDFSRRHQVRPRATTSMLLMPVCVCQRDRGASFCRCRSCPEGCRRSFSILGS